LLRHNGKLDDEQLALRDDAVRANLVLHFQWPEVPNIQPKAKEFAQFLGQNRANKKTRALQVQQAAICAHRKNVVTKVARSVQKGEPKNRRFVRHNFAVCIV
jgi:ribosomal protein S8E